MNLEINNLLDQCREKLGVPTDYKMAQEMKIKDARISDYRSGKRIPDAYACSKIAGVLEIDEMMLIAHFEAQSAKNPDVKEYWEKKLERLGGIAAGLFIAVYLIMTPTPSDAAPMLNPHNATVYIM